MFIVAKNIPCLINNINNLVFLFSYFPYDDEKYKRVHLNHNEVST